MGEEGEAGAAPRCINKNPNKSSAALNDFEKLHNNQQADEKIEQTADNIGRSFDYVCTRNFRGEEVEAINQGEYDERNVGSSIQGQEIVEVGLHENSTRTDEDGAVQEGHKNTVCPQPDEKSEGDEVQTADENRGEPEVESISGTVFRDLQPCRRRDERKQQVPAQSTNDKSKFESPQDGWSDRSEIISSGHTGFPITHHIPDEQKTGVQEEKCVFIGEHPRTRKSTEEELFVQAQSTQGRNMVSSKRVVNTDQYSADDDIAHNSTSCFEIFGRSPMTEGAEERTPIEDYTNITEVNVDRWPKLSEAISGDATYDECIFITRWVRRMNPSTQSKVEAPLKVEGVPSDVPKRFPSRGCTLVTGPITRMKTPRLVSNKILEEDFQLYAPKMLPLKVPVVEAFASFTSETTKWLTKAKVYEDLLRNVQKGERVKFSSDSMKNHVDQLLESGILRERKQHEVVKSWARIFKVPEVQKKRFRVIIEPRQLNEVLKPCLDEYDLRTTFATLEEVRRNVRQSPAFLAFDFKCYYYQIPLSEEVQLYFGVSICGRDFLVCRLPMGFTASVAIANRITRWVATEACRRETCTMQVQMIIQIDNIYFFGNEELLQRLERRMFEVAAECNITIGECTRQTTGVILGVQYNLSLKTIQLSKKFVQKHEALLDIIIENGKTPVIVWWRAFAIFLRVARVLDYSFSFLFYVFKAIRQVACAMARNTLSWTDEIQWTDKQVIAQLGLMYRMFKRNDEVKILSFPTKVFTEFVFSDASDNFLGVVFAKDVVQVFSRPWRKKEVTKHINEKEALALGQAVRLCEFVNPCFLCDSMVVVQACAKGLSKNIDINSTVSTLRTKYQHSPVLWVRSAQNPADRPSRNLPLQQIEWDVIEPFDAKGNEIHLS